MLIFSFSKSFSTCGRQYMFRIDKVLSTVFISLSIFGGVGVWWGAQGDWVPLLKILSQLGWQLNSRANCLLRPYNAKDRILYWRVKECKGLNWGQANPKTWTPFSIISLAPSFFKKKFISLMQYKTIWTLNSIEWNTVQLSTWWLVSYSKYHISINWNWLSIHLQCHTLLGRFLHTSMCVTLMLPNTECSVPFYNQNDTLSHSFNILFIFLGIPSYIFFRVHS